MPDSGDLPELFATALELDPSGRAALLERLRRESPATAERLDELLRASGSDGSLLDRPAPGLLPDDDAAELPNRVGPYRILREIGRGGMGRVFLAEQEGEAFRRRVALKLLDGPGVAGDRLRRFREEVRILATLEHPGIARFLDGGRANDGTWFLALEYVEGVDLLTHCRAQNLPLAERVQLVLEVLGAVAYAHGRGVVHRDLKPANIQVGADGRARLLDFGISKLVDPDAAERPATRTELRAYTPAYASPEQFRGESATASSDIFSLGVVLYELVSGVRPFGSATTPPNVLAAAVLAADPEPPSAAARRADTARRRAGTRHETAGADTPSTSAPAVRDDATTAPSRRLADALSDRDLDAICLEALQREPARRYANAAAFAADLAAYLDRRPVAARRGGKRYRLARFARRHRAGVLGGAALLLALGIGGAGIWWARSTRHPPEPPPQAFPFSGVETRPIDELASAFATQPASVEAGAQLALAQIESRRFQEAALCVRRLREIPGRELDPLTDYVEATLAQRRQEGQRALVLYSRALDAAREGGRGELVAQIRAARGNTLLFLGRHAEAHTDMEAARAAFSESHDWASLGRVLNDLAVERLIAGDLVHGEALLTLALRAVRDRAPSASQGAKALVMLGNLGLVSMERGQCDVAISRFDETATLARAASRPGQVGNALADKGSALWTCGHAAEADAALAESLRVLRPADDAQLIAIARSYGADIAYERGDLAAVADAIGELRRLSERANSEPLGNAERLAGRIAAAEGRYAEARSRFVEARNLLIAAGGDNFAAAAAVSAADAELEAGELERATRAAEDVASFFRGRTPLGDSTSLEAAEVALARVDMRSGRGAAAAGRLAAIDAAHHGGAASQPGVDQRLRFLAARAELSALGGRIPEARLDLERAVAVAAASDRTARELALRLQLAELDPPTARAAAQALERQARTHGLLALGERAHALAARGRRPG